MTEDTLPPHDDAAEAGALGCVLLANGTAAELFDQLHAEHFYDVRHQQVFSALRCLRTDGKALDTVTLAQWLRDKNRVEDAGGIAYIASLPEQTPSEANFPSFLETLDDRALRRAVLLDTGDLRSKAEDPAIATEQLRTAAKTFLSAYSGPDARLVDRLENRLFNITVKPPEALPRYRLAGVPICTPGNLTAISAIPKGGKSAFVSAMIAGPMASGGADCLGVESSNPHGHAIIHCDTEQSLPDHYALIERSMRRASVTALPSWVRSYCLTGFSVRDARQCVTVAAERALKECGGLFAILIDGVADLVCDVNDPEESAALVTELHAMAIRFNCPIIGVIHLNPGTEKTRGHLGSQLERKAETNLRLDRDGETVVVWADKNRRAPIMKSHGPRFAWSDDLQMHVAVQRGVSAKETAERTHLADLAESLFEGRSAMRRAEVETTLKNRLGVHLNTAYRKVDRMIAFTLIRKSVAGLYVLNTPAE
jgi:hypothetical protein